MPIIEIKEYGSDIDGNRGHTIYEFDDSDDEEILQLLLEIDRDELIEAIQCGSKVNIYPDNPYTDEEFCVEDINPRSYFTAADLEKLEGYEQ